MPATTASPSAAVRVADPIAGAIIGESLKLRASHPAAPALDVLDLVLLGRRARPIDFGELSPVSPFGLLVVEAFDRGMLVCDWLGLYRFGDPRVIAVLEDVWRKEVWPSFTAHFDIA
jgi:hypothetical protein